MLINKYSCIIPVYNEAVRIGDVLRVLTKVNGIEEIICIDDGSVDGSDSVIIKFTDVNLIKYSNNKGKTAAILEGLKSAKYESILLFDADDINLKASEIESAMGLFESEQLDCLLLTTHPMNFYYRLLRTIFPVCDYITGDRIVKKGWILKLLNKNKLKGYELEVAQNQYLIDNKKKVASVRLSAIDIGKTAKNGFIKGVVGEIKMWRQIISYIGLVSFLKQSFSLISYKSK